MMATGAGWRFARPREREDHAIPLEYTDRNMNHIFHIITVKK